ncbi:MAG: hypothetical protein ABI323_04505 [Solirubrobacteraceae bacterium]
MRTRGFIGMTLAAVALVLSLAGCGQSAQSRTPSVAAVPLPARARVLAQVTRCNPGANQYCAVQLVVVGRYGSSDALLRSERKYLKSLGWGLVNAQTADEHAAESPGHKFHLVFATAALDLKDVDLGWVRRSRTIARVLSQTMINRQSALSLMLESGAA